MFKSIKSFFGNIAKYLAVGMGIVAAIYAFLCVAKRNKVSEKIANEKERQLQSNIDTGAKRIVESTKKIKAKVEDINKKLGNKSKDSDVLDRLKKSIAKRNELVGGDNSGETE
jgi:seryl-tRNA synthetase